MRRVGRTARDMAGYCGVRKRFEEWAGAPAPPGAAGLQRIGAMLDAAAVGRWDDPEDAAITWRLTPADRAALRAGAIRRIEAAGGRVELGMTVATVAAGELRISMA